MAMLWNAHVAQPDSATQISYFLCALEEIIDTAQCDRFLTFKELLKIVAQHDHPQMASDGELVAFSKQKWRLLGRGRWSL